MIFYFILLSLSWCTSLHTLQKIQETQMHEICAKDATDKLITAFDSSDILAMQEALAAKAHIDFQGADGKTLLMIACEQGLDGMVEILLEFHANPTVANAQDNNKTALMYAEPFPGIQTMVLAVIARRNSIRQRERSERQIERKTDHGREEKNNRHRPEALVQEYVGNARSISVHAWELLTFEEQEQLNHTLRQLVFANKPADEIAACIAEGANPNAVDELGGSPLMCASTAQMVSLLVEHGAYVDLKDASGRTALNSAIEMRWFDAVEALIACGADVTYLRQNSVSAAGKCLRGDALMLAVEKGIAQYEQNKLFVDEQKNHHCVMMKRREMRSEQQKQREFSSDCSQYYLRDTSNLHGETPLMKAAGQGDDQLMKVLLLKGDDIYTCDKYGVPVLLYAVSSGSTDCVDLLLEAGLDLVKNHLGARVILSAKSMCDQKMINHLQKALEKQLELTNASSPKLPVDEKVRRENNKLFLELYNALGIKDHAMIIASYL